MVSGRRIVRPRVRAVAEQEGGLSGVLTYNLVGAAALVAVIRTLRRPTGRRYDELGIDTAAGIWQGGGVYAGKYAHRVPNGEFADPTVYTGEDESDTERRNAGAG